MLNAHGTFLGQFTQEARTAVVRGCQTQDGRRLSGSLSETEAIQPVWGSPIWRIR